jgi:hypothetical protein
MKTLMTLLATAIMVNFAIAQGTQVVAAKPETLVLKETSFDFGKIQQGRPVTHDFFVSNPSGTDTLKIEDVRASCGCTTPVWKREPVSPNATAKITVGYNAYSESPFEKTVTIFYNGGQTKILTIKGVVYKAPTTPAPENQGVDLLKKSNQ